MISCATASSSYVVDTTVSGQQVGVLPPDVPQELAGSLDSFQHVEAVMKEDDVSTVGMDSQDWELVTEMVAGLGGSPTRPPVILAGHGRDYGKPEAGQGGSWR